MSSVVTSYITIWRKKIKKYINAGNKVNNKKLYIHESIPFIGLMKGPFSLFNGRILGIDETNWGLEKASIRHRYEFETSIKRLFKMYLLHTLVHGLASRESFMIVIMIRTAVFECTTAVIFWESLMIVMMINTAVIVCTSCTTRNKYPLHHWNNIF